MRAVPTNTSSCGRLVCVCECACWACRVWPWPYLIVHLLRARRPIGLTTTAMQQIASRKFRISPANALKIAETLYQQGLLSYPRTETEIFPPSMNLEELIKFQTNDPSWGAFATQLVAPNGHPDARNGKKTDEAHPPIHPTKPAQGLQGDEKQIYDLVTRHFLACCSRNAKAQETKVEIQIDTETFAASGRMVTDRGYLEVYPYENWGNNSIPLYELHQEFEPTMIELEAVRVPSRSIPLPWRSTRFRQALHTYAPWGVHRTSGEPNAIKQIPTRNVYITVLFGGQGETTAPQLLTEADLLGLMDRNEIGTDASKTTCDVVHPGWVPFLISSGSRHVLRAHMGRTCGARRNRAACRSRVFLPLFSGHHG